MERDQDCPVCGESEEFYRAASTTLNLGLKVKWRCGECGYTTVQIADAVDTATA
jgi:rubrerythrin